jgi:hypothetical protein
VPYLTVLILIDNGPIEVGKIDELRLNIDFIGTCIYSYCVSPIYYLLVYLQPNISFDDPNLISSMETALSINP